MDPILIQINPFFPFSLNFFFVSPFIIIPVVTGDLYVTLCFTLGVCTKF